LIIQKQSRRRGEQKYTDEEIEKTAGFDKTLDNDKYSVLRLKNHQAWIKYGKNTRWDPAANSDEGQHWYDELIRKGSSCYFILNKDTKERYIIEVELSGITTVYDDHDDYFKLSKLFKILPDLEADLKFVHNNTVKN